MTPHDWINTYWRGNLKPQVFVAMSFWPEFKPIWQEVIKPAIEVDLKKTTAQTFVAYRVDTEKRSGSILKDIYDGIAHSQLVLADISIASEEGSSWKGQRNGNVMFELGIAATIRPDHGLIVIRGDEKSLPFDISSLRAHSYSRSDFGRARALVADLCKNALDDQRRSQDDFATLTWSRLDFGCLDLMHRHRNDPAIRAQRNRPDELLAVRRLLELGICRCEFTGAETNQPTAQYSWTEFGKAVLARPRLPALPVGFP